MIIIVTIWLIGSLITIYITDHNYYWNKLYKILISASLLALIINGWKIYDPNLNHMIATIELNSTWELALILSITEGICIAGPIAALHIYYEHRRIKTEKEKFKRRG